MATRRGQAVLWEGDGFAVTEMGLTVSGHPSVEMWATVGVKLAKSRSGVQWAIGDWLLYGDEREYDEGMYEAAAESTGLKRGTLMNLKAVAKAFPKHKRSVSLGWSHYALVAGFDDDQRGELLRAAARNKLSWEELREQCRELRHATQLAARTWPEGTFGVLLASCPWRYSAGALDPVRAATQLSTESISALSPNVQRITAPDAVLYAWVPPPMVEDGLAVGRAWGFTFQTSQVWVQDTAGGGNWQRDRHELLFLFTRGNPLRPADDLRPDSVLSAARRPGGQKPVLVYDQIERCYEGVPMVELFAREAREGWTAWGHEIEEATRLPRARGIVVPDAAAASV